MEFRSKIDESINSELESLHFFLTLRKKMRTKHLQIDRIKPKNRFKIDLK